jgi:hypothetical protein
MIAPLAVEPVALPTAPPTTVPAPAPAAAPFSVLLMLAHPIPESVSPSASRVMNGSVKAFLACTCLMAGKGVIAKKSETATRAA